MCEFNAVRSKFQLDKFVKRLRFQGNYADYTQLELNRFTQLEELRIDVAFTRPVDVTFTRPVDVTEHQIAIALPNLRILDAEDYNHQIGGIGAFRKFVLATPQLVALRCCTIASFSFSHADTIKHLQMYWFCDEPDELPMTYAMTNVRRLTFTDNVPCDYIYGMLLAQPKLQTVVGNVGSMSSTDWETAWERVNFWLKEKCHSRRPALRVYFQSVEMVASEVTDTINYDKCKRPKSILEFQMNNYHLLNEFVFWKASRPLDYNELMGLIKGRSLPVDFFRKYRNVAVVQVSGGGGDDVNQEHLLQFLKRLHCFKELRLDGTTTLDQSFFDGLCELTELTGLYMRNSSTLIVRHDFLRKMKNLLVFESDHDAPEFCDLSLALFTELAYFRHMEFVCRNELIQVQHCVDGYAFRRNEFRQGWIEHFGNALHGEDRLRFEQLTRLVQACKNGTLDGYFNGGILPADEFGPVRFCASLTYSDRLKSNLRTKK